MSTLSGFGKTTVSRIWDVAFYNLSRNRGVSSTLSKHVSILWGIVYTKLSLTGMAVIVDEYEVIVDGYRVIVDEYGVIVDEYGSNR